MEILIYGTIHDREFVAYQYSRNSPPSFRSVYRTFGPTSPGELLPATTNSPYMYILSYPGIAFKFPVPSNTPPSPSDKDLLNLLHKTDPPCLASSLVIFSGSSWTDIRKALNESKPHIFNIPKKRRKSQANVSLEESDQQIDFAEIFPNDKIELYFKNGNTVSLIYETFAAQDAITLLGSPNEIYTKSDKRLNIHNQNSHSRNDTEIDTGPLSEGLSSYRLAPPFSPSFRVVVLTIL